MSAALMIRVQGRLFSRGQRHYGVNPPMLTTLRLFSASLSKQGIG